MRPVAALRLIVIGESRKNQDNVGIFRRYGLDSPCFKGILRRCHFHRMNHGTSGALITHVFEQFTCNVELFPAAKRQHAVVFQKNCTVRGDLSGECMMGFPVHRRRIGRLNILFYKAEDSSA